MASGKQGLRGEPRDTAAEIIGRQNSATEKTLVHANFYDRIALYACFRQIVCLNFSDLFQTFAKIFCKQSFAFKGEGLGVVSELSPNRGLAFGSVRHSANASGSKSWIEASDVR